MRPDRRNVFFAAAGLVAVSAAVFFTQRDLPTFRAIPGPDLYYFYANPNTWDLGEWRSLFTADYGAKFCPGFYHPLAYLLVMGVAGMFGHDPLPARCLQIGLLLAAAVLIALVERKRLGAWGWLAAVVYVLSYAQYMPGITAIRDQLLVVFMLISLEVRRGGRPESHRRCWALAGVFGAALLSKEAALFFPAILLADDWLAGRLGTAKDRRGAAVAYVYMACVLAGYSLFRVMVLGPDFTLDLGLGYAALETPAAFAARVTDLAAAISWGAAAPFWAEFLFAGVVLAGLYLGRGAYFYTAWLTGWLFFYSGFLPIQSLSIMVAKSHDERHRLLLPAVGFAWLVALSLREYRGRRLLGLLPGACVLLLQARAPRLSNNDVRADLRDTLPALSFNLRHSPDWASGYREALKARYGAKAGDIEEYYLGALDDPCRSVYLMRQWMSPELDLVTHVDAGLAFKRGEYHKALALDPDYAEAERGLAAALSAKGRHKEALEASRRYSVALLRQPYLSNARCPIR